MPDLATKTRIWSAVTGGCSGFLLAISVGRMFTNVMPATVMYAFDAVVVLCIWRLIVWRRRLARRDRDARLARQAASRLSVSLLRDLPDDDRRWVESQLALAHHGEDVRITASLTDWSVAQTFRWPTGALVTCPDCGRTAIKTPGDGTPDGHGTARRGGAVLALCAACQEGGDHG